MGRELRAYTLVLLGIVCGLVWGGACSSSETTAMPMHAGGWTTIASTTLASDSATVQFATIPTGYRLLRIVGTFTHAAAAPDILNLRLNSDTATNYQSYHLQANISDLMEEFFNAQQNLIPLTYTNTAGVPVIIDTLICNNPALGKRVCSRSVGVNEADILVSGLWYNATDEIDTIDLWVAGGDIVAGSSFFLLGLK